jgi:hypothetical protein
MLPILPGRLEVVPELIEPVLPRRVVAVAVEVVVVEGRLMVLDDGVAEPRREVAVVDELLPVAERDVD